MKISIRPITNRDSELFRKTLDTVAKERVFLLSLEAPSLERITNFISSNISKGYPQFVAEDNNKIIGWADFIPDERKSLNHTAHLGMGVLKEYRGKGVGKSLLISVTEAAIKFGFTRLELEVFSNNIAAISLYKSQGFIHEGTKKNARFIDGKYYDVFIMGKIFT